MRSLDSFSSTWWILSMRASSPLKHAWTQYKSLVPAGLSLALQWGPFRHLGLTLSSHLAWTDTPQSLHVFPSLLRPQIEA